MALPHAIPGSFPMEPPGPSVSYTPENNSIRSPEIQQISVDDALRNSFLTRETAHAKTMAQKHLVGQLDTFTYFVIGYQFLKYTHGSCMPPTLAHCLVQLSLYARHFTAVGPESARPIFAEHLSAQERHFQAAGLSFDRHKIVRFIVAKTRNVILWKFLGCFVYHILLVLFYLQPVANAGRLHLLENGSWYFISFLGESISQDYSSTAPWWLRLWKLGFCGLLFTDVVILVLQLILYQSIFLQSTVSPKGLRLNEPECYILRSSGSGTGVDPDSVEGEVPDIFHVKLYESLGEDPMAGVSA
ncbi:hypothetical protein JCM33374_g4979 [Metschnikowia sp. JCM 33374]|nr:hypothetical protein JCM33374_g4979 [Metschnikowia sp. JCM 33374]